MEKPQGDLLLKFGRRDHMEQLRRDGILYMNTLAYFRKAEQGVGDPDEGLKSHYQPTRVNVRITIRDGRSFTWSADDGSLDGPITVRNYATDQLNVFCMYVLKWRGEKTLIDKQNLVFGDTYVWITDWRQFFERIDFAVKRENLHIAKRAVEYVPRNEHHGVMGAFRKFTGYEHQSEFRFVISPGFGHPYQLILGDISDIAIIGDARDIIDKNLEIQLLD